MPIALTSRLLNHASTTVEWGSHRLLFDPWFAGTSFGKGWGLRFENPDALRQAAECTHLWVSHFHPDHFHTPTLRALSEQNPDLCVLANRSVNFDAVTTFQSLGFRNVVPLRERSWLTLAEDFRVWRCPSAAIDNLLLIEMGPFRILNLNDCNFPRFTFRKIMKKLGHVDLLFVNFNHAGKLLDAAPVELIKRKYRDMFHSLVDEVSPRWTIPFAAHHYYRGDGSRAQNESLLSVDDLLPSPSLVRLRVGDRATCHSDGTVEIERREPPLPECTRTSNTYERIDWRKLLAAADAYCALVRAQFYGRSAWIPAISIYVQDHDKTLDLNISRGAWESAESPHIATHSETLLGWFTSAHGADTFWVGADFSIETSDISRVNRLQVGTLLAAHGLSPRQLAKLGGSRGGLRFFWSRREEILGHLTHPSWQVRGARLLD